MLMEIWMKFLFSKLFLGLHKKTVWPHSTDFHWMNTGLRIKQIFPYFSFERQQALVQEQLNRLAQRERESATTTDLDDLTPALIIEKEKAFKEQDKVKMLVSHAVKISFRSLNCTFFFYCWPWWILYDCEIYSPKLLMSCLILHCQTRRPALVLRNY